MFDAISEEDDVKEDLSDVVMVGDSMLRDQGVIFRRRTKKRALVKCFPGAGIEKISGSLPKVKSALQATVVSVGTNDVGENSSAELRLKYRNLLAKLSGRRSPSIIVGLLPRMKEGKTWSDRARELNLWLHRQCNERNLIFINLLEHFSLSPNLYRHDGIHLTLQGKEFIADTLGDIISESAIYDPFLE